MYKMLFGSNFVTVGFNFLGTMLLSNVCSGNDKIQQHQITLDVAGTQCRERLDTG